MVTRGIVREQTLFATGQSQGRFSRQPESNAFGLDGYPPQLSWRARNGPKRS